MNVLNNVCKRINRRIQSLHFQTQIDTKYAKMCTNFEIHRKRMGLVRERLLRTLYGVLICSVLIHKACVVFSSLLHQFHLKITFKWIIVCFIDTNYVLFVCFNSLIFFVVIRWMCVCILFTSRIGIILITYCCIVYTFSTVFFTIVLYSCIQR